MAFWGAGWSRDDKIRWITARLRERRLNETGKTPRYRTAPWIRDSRSLEVWLAKEEDGMSWQQIAIKYYPEYRKSASLSAAISKARRDYMLVERGPSPRQSFKHAMEETIRDVFNCTPQDFKRYLASIRFDKPNK